MLVLAPEEAVLVKGKRGNYYAAGDEGWSKQNHAYLKAVWIDNNKYLPKSLEGKVLASHPGVKWI